MTKQTNESESLGVMIARMKQKQTARDWNKKSQAEKVADLKKHQADLKKRMEEGKNHTWKSEGHYTKDGKEWKGPQHAHDGQVMTGEKHTADSQNLYHFKALSPEVKKKVLEKMKMDEGIVDTIMKSKTLNKGNYAIAAKELDKKMKKDPSKSKTAHAHDVARYVKNVDARKLAAEDYVKGCPLLEKLKPSDGIGTYIKDFKKSDAPQFKGASASKRRKMAVAAYLGAKRKSLEELNRHGIPKDATKAELQKIRSNPNASKGAKNLAHWKLNMHHNESIKYDSSMGGHEWGTPQGTDQMKSVTPGQKNPKEDPIKPLETKTLVALNVKDEYVKEAKEMSKKNPVAKNLNKFNKPATHKDRKNDYSRKDKHKGKIYEETEAGETKAEYRDDNAINAPEAGIVPLTQDDIKHLYWEIENMSEDDMEDYGFFDDEDDCGCEEECDCDDYPDDEIQITEILSVQGRLKRKFAARKNRQRLKVARNIALRRGSSPDRLKRRATRGARAMVYKRLLKGRDKTQMPPAEKARFEKLIGMYQPLIQRFATRMLPKMRKMEINRMKNRKGKAAQKAKKYKAARPIAKASSQKAKKFKVKK